MHHIRIFEPGTQLSNKTEQKDVFSNLILGSTGCMDPPKLAETAIYDAQMQKMAKFSILRANNLLNHAFYQNIRTWHTAL